MSTRPAWLTSIGAVSAATTAMLILSPNAHATEADDQFLSVVASLGLEFGTVDQAIAAGNNICDITAEGSANGLGVSVIQSSIIESLQGEGLDPARARQLMRGAVDAYCPQYNAVVSD
ncbi:MAG: DUF732 domain-containing protein [Actinomycetia bacterium]|nr:DUF732 domain-containing protein [Actinomycetes bacterium]MCH9759040.1 DUF732 domain-containing protein [Actinomycetes bacterium]